MKNLAFIFLIFLSAKSGAVPEEQLLDVLNSHILPFVSERTQKMEFVGVGKARIRYIKMTQENPRGVIIISPGQSEPAMKYAEVLYDMRDWGYDIFVIDHRGQGFSSRLIPDSKKSHVENFSDYVDDFTYFVDKVVQPKKYKTSAILAHSMGGAIATGYLQRNTHGVSKVALISPMIEINTGIYGESFGMLLAKAAVFSGLETAYAPNQHSLEKEYLTTSGNRFEMNMKILNQFPELLVGATTFRWVRESLTFTKNLREKAEIQIPSRLFTAPNDKITVPFGAVLICGRSPQCIAHQVLDAEHEILMEKDFIRNPVIEEIRIFFEREKTP